MIEFTVVVLPAPFRPISVTTSVDTIFRFIPNCYRTLLR